MPNILPADAKIDVRQGIDNIGVTVTSIISDGNGKTLMMKRGVIN